MQEEGARGAGLLQVSGWVEVGGRRLAPLEIETIVWERPLEILRFGGEFFLDGHGCRARDHLGIMPGPCPPGTLTCNGVEIGKVAPVAGEMPLEEAIVTAVGLRSDEGVTALSGGVDSALVAVLAGRPCVAAGLEGSHDLARARLVADTLGLPLETVTITPAEIGAVLPEVVQAIPLRDPPNTAIALAQYFVARWAGEHGYRRILSGQGADELFGGYHRYLTNPDLDGELRRDAALLPLQTARDQAVAALHGTCFSLPYLDLRVVRAAESIPAGEKVQDGTGKVPLRIVAERYLPRPIAWYPKKAMQYGSGVARVLRRLARNNGYKTSIQDYIHQISQVDHGQ